MYVVIVVYMICQLLNLRTQRIIKSQNFHKADYESLIYISALNRLKCLIVKNDQLTFI